MELYQILAITVSAAAITISLVSFLKSRTITMYQDLDRLYFEILKIAVEHPEFVDPKATLDYPRSFAGREKLQYETYAFMVWNFCETIADRRKHRALYETWQPVLNAENKLHRDWFDNSENSHKFKTEFRTFIAKNYPARAVIGSGTSLERQ